MSGPDNDSRIKEKLGSPRETDQDQGLEILDAAYRNLSCGDLRRWARRRRISLSDDDLGGAWNETLCNTWIKARLRILEFDEKKTLREELWTIMHRRGVDLVRKRLRKSEQMTERLSEVLLDLLAAGIDLSLDELLEVITACAKKLSEKEGLTLLVDVRMLLQNGEATGKYTWPTIRELAREVSRVSKKKVSDGAVRSRRARARKMIRACLKRRGYDNA